MKIRALWSDLVFLRCFSKVFLDFQKWTKKMSKIENPKKLLEKSCYSKLRQNINSIFNTINGKDTEILTESMILGDYYPFFKIT